MGVVAMSKSRLTSAQSQLLNDIAEGKELLILGAGWAEYFAVEPDQNEPEVSDRTRQTDRLVFARLSTVDALIKKGVFVLRRTAYDKDKVPTFARGWVRKWYSVERIL